MTILNKKGVKDMEKPRPAGSVCITQKKYVSGFEIDSFWAKNLGAGWHNIYTQEQVNALLAMIEELEAKQ
jgi:hypothetical protein